MKIWIQSRIRQHISLRRPLLLPPTSPHILRISLHTLIMLTSHSSIFLSFWCLEPSSVSVFMALNMTRLVYLCLMIFLPFVCQHFMHTRCASVHSEECSSAHTHTHTQRVQPTRQTKRVQHPSLFKHEAGMWSHEYVPQFRTPYAPL